MKLVDTIIGMVTLGTVNNAGIDTDFDMNKYQAPVRNSKRNILIDNIQWGLFSVNIFSWLMLLFINLGALELVLMNLVPIAIIIVIERFKDQAAQEAYDKYAEWEEMKEDYLENIEEEDLYD
jgi:hypothetical protein